MKANTIRAWSKITPQSKAVDSIAQRLISLGLIFLPISSTLSSLITIGAVLALCFGAEIRKHLGELFILPISKATLILVLFLGFRIFFNDYDIHSSIHNFIKYSHKLLTFIILIPLFSTKEARKNLEDHLLMGALLFTVLLSLEHAHLVNFEALFHSKNLLQLSEIPWSLYLCTSSFIAMQRVLSTKKNRWLYLALWFTFSLYLFNINIERTGMICYIALMGWLMIKTKAYKTINPKIFAGIILALSLILISSPSIKLRITHSLKDIQRYQAGDAHSSLGLRANFATHSLILLKEKPLLGHGIGNFPKAYQTTGGLTLARGQLLGDPHNTYLHLAVQIGLIGLLIYIIWLSKIFKLTTLIQHKEKYMAQGLLLTLILASFSVDALLRTRICTLFTTLIACYLGQFFEHKSPTDT